MQIYWSRLSFKLTEHHSGKCIFILAGASKARNFHISIFFQLSDFILGLKYVKAK